jgi:hypothetical protein
MDPTAVGQPRVNEGHRVVKTCNLTYFNAGTSGSHAARSGALGGGLKRGARLSRRARFELAGQCLDVGQIGEPVSVLPDIRCSGNPADKQTAGRALYQSDVRGRLWPVAQRPRQDRSEHDPKFAVGSPRFPPPLP